MKLNQIGDTIIEAMIAVAIVGMTIAGAYAVASRSLQAARQAQERGEALKLAEGQLETIRSIASNSATDDDGEVTNTSQVFCMKDNGESHRFGGSTIPAVVDDNLDAYPSECTDGLYHISILAANLSGPRYQYTVVVRWFGIGESRIEELRMDYRVYLEAS